MANRSYSQKITPLSTVFVYIILHTVDNYGENSVNMGISITIFGLNTGFLFLLPIFDSLYTLWYTFICKFIVHAQQLSTF